MAASASKIDRDQVSLVLAFVLTFSILPGKLPQRSRRYVEFDQGDVGDALTDILVEHAAVAAKRDEQAFARGKRNGHAAAFVLPYLRAGPETGGQEGLTIPRSTPNPCSAMPLGRLSVA